jgi:primary-amine oxidase
MFVTPYKEEEIFPSDIHINQNLGGEDFGLQKWVNRDENVRNTDIVCWPCFGVTHISRPEDWPIMPVEILRVHMKPSGFFDVSAKVELLQWMVADSITAQPRVRRTQQSG